METCPRCESQDLVGFAISPTGKSLWFSHCRSCEHRWWAESDGDVVRLPDVLEHLSVHAGRPGAA